MVASVVITGAARKPERGELPKVRGAGLAKAVVSNHCAAVWLSIEGSRTRFGRSEPAGNALVVLAAVITVKAGPDSAVSNSPNFQPPISAFFLGTSYSSVTTKR